MASSPSNSGLSDPEQDKWLEDAKEFIKKQTYFMKRGIDSGNVRDVLRFASAMTGELRTSRLSPKNYYDLFMLITDELRELELFVEDEDAKGDAAIKTIVELYEEVQHAGNIIPRLYLLITIASVYIRSKKAPAKDVLFDLVELCRGVQHPMRGLFLRHYLSQISKDKLPDIGSAYEGEGGNYKDAIEFILQNFGEMNKLWVRMQSQGAVRDKHRREKERRNLRQLVGTNLVRLSELRGVDLATYQEIVLPRVLEQIINCKDVIAQEYLMDAIVQVFSVDFHLMTLEQYLSSCAQLQESVNVKDIIIALMNKLAVFAQESPASLPSDLDMFPVFHKYTSQIINTNTKVTLQDTLALQVALLNFATRVYPERIDYVDNVLGFTVEVLKKTGSATVESKCVSQVVELLSLPLDALQLQILSLANFAPLMSFLELPNRRTIATNIATAIVKARSPLDTVDKVEKLLTYIAPAIFDEVESQPAAELDRFEFDQEQHLIARLFHLIGNENTDVHFQLYQTTRKHFGKGGKDRIEFTLPALVHGSLQLAQRIFARESAGEASLAVKTKKVFGFVHETITVLRTPYSELAFRLFILAGQMADQCAYDPIAYEYIVQAFLTYEEEIAESKAQFAAITLLVASLSSFKNLTQESYDTLVSKATQHASKLLKKTDQCKAVSLCAQMFWPVDDKLAALRDEKRVLACLQRALKIANGCVGHQVPLFVEILNQYLYFYDKQCPSITVKYLKGLISLIDEHLKTLELSTEANKQAKRYYENTLAHIKFKQESDQAARFLEITAGEKEASTSFDD